MCPLRVAWNSQERDDVERVVQILALAHEEEDERVVDGHHEHQPVEHEDDRELALLVLEEGQGGPGHQRQVQGARGADPQIVDALRMRGLVEREDEVAGVEVTTEKGTWSPVSLRSIAARRRAARTAPPRRGEGRRARAAKISRAHSSSRPRGAPNRPSSAEAKAGSGVFAGLESDLPTQQLLPDSACPRGLRRCRCADRAEPRREHGIRRASRRALCACASDAGQTAQQ